MKKINTPIMSRHTEMTVNCRNLGAQIEKCLELRDTKPPKFVEASNPFKMRWTDFVDQDNPQVKGEDGKTDDFTWPQMGMKAPCQSSVANTAPHIREEMQLMDAQKILHGELNRSTILTDRLFCQLAAQKRYTSHVLGLLQSLRTLQKLQSDGADGNENSAECSAKKQQFLENLQYFMTKDDGVSSSKKIKKRNHRKAGKQAKTQEYSGDRPGDRSGERAIQDPQRKPVNMVDRGGDPNVASVDSFMHDVAHYQQQVNDTGPNSTQLSCHSFTRPISRDPSSTITGEVEQKKKDSRRRRRLKDKRKPKKEVQWEDKKLPPCEPNHHTSHVAQRGDNPDGVMRSLPFI